MIVIAGLGNPGKEYEVLGLVKGTVVQTKNVGRDFMAGMKNVDFVWTCA